MISFYFWLPRAELRKTRLLCNDKRLILDAFKCLGTRACVSAWALRSSVTLASWSQLPVGVDARSCPAFLTIYLLYILSFDCSRRHGSFFYHRMSFLASFLPSTEPMFPRVRPHMCTFAAYLTAVVSFSLRIAAICSGEADSASGGALRVLQSYSCDDRCCLGVCSFKPLLGEHLEGVLCFTLNSCLLLRFLLKWFPLSLFCCVWFLPSNKSCFFLSISLSFIVTLSFLFVCLCFRFKSFIFKSPSN